MTTGRAIHRGDDGTETDITEGVQALYDLVISSMDWGSGFWTEDDAAPVSLIGHLLAFAQIERVDEYIADRVHDREESAWRSRYLPPIFSARSLLTADGLFSGLFVSAPVVDHEHVLSSVGRCMWPRCSYREQP